MGKNETSAGRTGESKRVLPGLRIAPVSRRSKLRAVLAGAACVALGLPAPALAFQDWFIINQGLSAGNAKSSTSVGKGNMWVHANADHTFCPGIGKGWSGYTSQPFSGGNTTIYASQDCGPHTQYSATYQMGSSYWRGVVYNPNSTTYDQFDHAIYMADA